MKSTLNFIFRTILGTVLVLFIVSVILQIIFNFSSILKGALTLPSVWLGVLLYIVYVAVKRMIFKNRRSSFFSTFTHELTHTIFALIFFKRVDNFAAAAGGGGKVSISRTSNPLIILSPYCIPIYTLFILVIRIFMIPSSIVYIDGLIGYTLAFHLYTFFTTARPSQSDIRSMGYLFSYIFIIALNIMVIMIIYNTLSYNLLGGFFSIWGLIKESILDFVAFINRII